MKSQPVSDLLTALQITKSFGRPSVSNDNPYSESHFKTLKYQPAFPERFGCIEDLKVFCRHFFSWYNNIHYHKGLALLTPAVVHQMRTEEVLTQRSVVLNRAHAQNPDRFVNGVPRANRPPSTVWINPPLSDKPGAGKR